VNILVIDAQGGGVGRQLISAIRAKMPTANILAVGTNSTATAVMLKAGATAAATGENPVIVGCRKADVIIGPVGIVIADAMHGEITPRMAQAIAQSNAVRILIPFSHCNNIIVGINDYSQSRLIQSALDELEKVCNISDPPGF